MDFLFKVTCERGVFFWDVAIMIGNFCTEYSIIKNQNDKIRICKSAEFDLFLGNTLRTKSSLLQLPKSLHVARDECHPTSVSGPKIQWLRGPLESNVLHNLNI